MEAPLEKIEAKLYSMALEGNWNAIRFTLINRAPARWQDHPEPPKEDPTNNLLEVLSGFSGLPGCEADSPQTEKEDCNGNADNTGASCAGSVQDGEDFGRSGPYSDAGFNWTEYDNYLQYLGDH